MSKVKLILIILAAFAAVAQGQIVAVQLQGTGEPVGTAANNICARSTVNVVRQSATTLTVGFGTSNATPAIVRLASLTSPRTRVISAPIALNIVGGAGVDSTIEIWGVPSTTGLGIYVINSSGSTMSCTPSCTTTIAGTPTAVTARAGIRLATWQVLAGTPVTFALTGGTVYNTAVDCNLQSISLFNNSAGAVTVTLATASGLQLPWVGPFVINPFSVAAIAAPATGSVAGPTTGIYQEGGLLVSASVGGVVTMHFNTILYTVKGQ